MTTLFANRLGALQITWCVHEHHDKNNNVCHGMVDKTAFALGAHLSPHLSKKFRLSIERLLRAGLTVKAILQNHQEKVIAKYKKDHPDEEDSAKWSRDM